MGHAVELPESLYRQVAEYAARRHEEPGAIIVSWLMDAMHRAESQIAVANDVASDEPMNLLAGIINVSDADAGDYHDRYFSMDDDDAAKS